MTDAIERVQIVKADGSVLSTTTQRQSAPTVEVGNWIADAQAKIKSIQAGRKFKCELVKLEEN